MINGDPDSVSQYILVLTMADTPTAECNSLGEPIVLHNKWNILTERIDVRFNSVVSYVLALFPFYSNENGYTTIALTWCLRSCFIKRELVLSELQAVFKTSYIFMSIKGTCSKGTWTRQENIGLILSWVISWYIVFLSSMRMEGGEQNGNINRSTSTLGKHKDTSDCSS